MKGNKGNYICFVDTGGTFSDGVVVAPDGSVVTGKSFTTPDKLEECFFNCLSVCAENMRVSLEELVSQSRAIGYGTTIGTNMIVSDSPGPKLGMLTTRGVEDRTIVWRHRPAGLSGRDKMHMIVSGHPRHLIPRYMIKGITERTDSRGEIVIPLREDEVRAAGEYFLEQGVEGIAVCYLWSFLNNAHEVRTKEIIRELAPNINISTSSEVAPVIREYPRFMTTIIDLHIGNALRSLLDTIEGKLLDYGYKYPLLVMQAIGGVTQSKIVHPATTLHSGPVGGLAGVEFMKGLYGMKNAIGSDVGGTSFDVTISREWGEEFLREPVVGRYEIGNPMREIITIGAGGGTIAWIEPATNTIRVGPQSAGSSPGPVCYCKGGEEPTVTDADVVLNRIDPDYFLGGKIKLDRERALASIKKLADQLGIDPVKVAEGIGQIVDNAMKAILKTSLSTKGIDPEDYVLFAFGGAGGAHCAGYSEGLGFKKVIIPSNASVFSAFGASTADNKHRYEASPFILWSNLPFDKISHGFKLDALKSMDQVPAWTVERYNRMIENLENRAHSELRTEGFNEEEIKLNYELLARYGGQLWEVRCPTTVTRIENIEDVKGIIRSFEEEYLRVYSQESKVPAGGFELVSVGLTARASLPKPKAIQRALKDVVAADAIKGERDVYFDGWVKTVIYDFDLLESGNLVSGPAIIECRDTTVVVPPNRKVLVDEFKNMVMEDK